MVSTPELKKYVDKKILLQLNGSRKVAGVLRGYDIFLNVVLDDALEISPSGTQQKLGSQTVIRGNSIVSMEALDSIV
ncbi:Small nuclear ribonucleoprotein G [Nakaseomyces bracarensis]|uniref:Small nuclear ribonucleoprotein G n=1 Tax=Nakaseomyces bracarensis TaxID=273131 RepID=A0ABR4NX75_9SACH